jgi:hypothetical protein
MKIFILDKIKEMKDQLTDKGARPDTLIVSMEGYHKLHNAVQKTLNREITVLTQFYGLEIITHPLCSDDAIHIIDSKHLRGLDADF